MNYSVKHVKLFIFLLINLLVALNISAARAGILSKSSLKAKLFRAVNGYGKPEGIKALLDQGADPNSKDYYGRTVLMKAVKTYRGYHQEQVVKLFIDAGANVNARDKKGETALMKAMFTEKERLVELLKSAGATLSGRDLQTVNKTIEEQARKRAIYRERLEKARRIVAESSAKKKVKAAKKVIKPVAIIKPPVKKPKAKVIKVDTARVAQRVKNSKLFKTLRTRANVFTIQQILKEGADINSRDIYDRTPLMLAVDKFYLFHHLAILNLLIDSGADVNARDRKGETSLMRALIRGHDDVVNVLKDAGAVATAEDLRKIESKRKDMIRRRELIKGR